MYSHRSSDRQRHAPSRYESLPNRPSQSYRSTWSHESHENSQYWDVPSGNYSPWRYAQHGHFQYRDATHDQRDYYHHLRGRFPRSPTPHDRYVEYSQRIRAPNRSDYSFTESNGGGDYPPRRISSARQDPRDPSYYEEDFYTRGRDRYAREHDHSPRRILPSRYESGHTRTHEDSSFSREVGPLQHRPETLPSTQAVDDYLSRQLESRLRSIFEEIVAKRAARIATEASETRSSSPQSQTPVAATISEKDHDEQAATTPHVVPMSKTPAEIYKHMQDELKGLLAMEYDSNAEPPLIPYGFGSAWDDSASVYIFPWKYGATKSCNLGLCKDMFMGKTCRDYTCTHAHNWLSYDQLAYLLGQPDARTRKAAREFVHDFFPLWFHAWVNMDMPTFDDPVPPKPPTSLTKSWRLPLLN